MRVIGVMSPIFVMKGLVHLDVVETVRRVVPPGIGYAKIGVHRERLVGVNVRSPRAVYFAREVSVLASKPGAFS